MAYLQRIGAKANGAPYKGSPHAVTDLVSWPLSFMVMDLSGLPILNANRARALAITSPERLPDLPNVPTLAEAGMGDFDVPSWIGMYTPAGVPEAIVRKLSAAQQVALRTPSVVKGFTECCSERPFPSTSAEFADYVARDRVLWAARIAAAGIQPE